MNYPPKINPTKETKKITAFIKDTFKKACKTKAVVAVSGGVDSSTTLLLTAQALGPKNIHVLHLPRKTTDPTHLEHAQIVTHLAKIPEKNIACINITGIIQKTWRIIKRYTTEEVRPPNAKRSNLYATPRTSDRKRINQQIARLNRLRLANLAARIRMILIFDQAKLHDALVIGTENRSEHLLGYFTRYGDEASDLEPTRHLYKTQIRQLAKHLKVPEEIIQKPPSAGLWKGQTDEAELGFSYNEADPILFLKYEQQMSSKRIIEKLSKNTQKNSEEIRRFVTEVLKRINEKAFKHHVPYTL